MGVLEKDFEYVSNSNISFDRFKNKVILITGATGLVGSLLVKNFAYCNKKYGLDLKIIAIIRNTDKQRAYLENCTTKKILRIYHVIWKRIL